MVWEALWFPFSRRSLAQLCYDVPTHSTRTRCDDPLTLTVSRAVDHQPLLWMAGQMRSNSNSKRKLLRQQVGGFWFFPAVHAHASSMFSCIGSALWDAGGVSRCGGAPLDVLVIYHRCRPCSLPGGAQATAADAKATVEDANSAATKSKNTRARRLSYISNESVSPAPRWFPASTCSPSSPKQQQLRWQQLRNWCC